MCSAASHRLRSATHARWAVDARRRGDLERADHHHRLALHHERQATIREDQARRRAGMEPLLLV